MGMALPRALKVTNVWDQTGPEGTALAHRTDRRRTLAPGQRVGNALLRSLLEMADQDGRICYLQTDVDRNVSPYEKFGFRVIGQADILGVNSRFMRRDAKLPVT